MTTVCIQHKIIGLIADNVLLCSYISYAILCTSITRFVVIYYALVCELHTCHSTLNGLISSCLVVLIHAHIYIYL